MRTKVPPKSTLQTCHAEEGESPAHGATQRALPSLATGLLCAQAHAQPVLPELPELMWLQWSKPEQNLVFKKVSYKLLKELYTATQSSESVRHHPRANKWRLPQRTSRFLPRLLSHEIKSHLLSFWAYTINKNDERLYRIIFKREYKRFSKTLCHHTAFKNIKKCLKKHDTD